MDQKHKEFIGSVCASILFQPVRESGSFFVDQAIQSSQNFGSDRATLITNIVENWVLSVELPNLLHIELKGLSGVDNYNNLTRSGESILKSRDLFIAMIHDSILKNSSDKITSQSNYLNYNCSGCQFHDDHQHFDFLKTKNMNSLKMIFIRSRVMAFIAADSIRHVLNNKKLIGIMKAVPSEIISEYLESLLNGSTLHALEAKGIIEDVLNAVKQS
jgi:hypothetical protein